MYQGSGDARKPVVAHSLNGKKYVLMVRPKEVQDEENKAYGNLGKAQAYAEQEGAASSNLNADPGMLPERVLRAKGVETGQVERNDAQFVQTPLGHIGGHMDATRTT